ncbi:aldo/keto reductase [Micromonospora sp. DPT]|uniref:aldo/keto reductase n=1 Tax=Micromonospora sp. DPT TaxID=3142975 RepID=UPI003207EA74
MTGTHQAVVPPRALGDAGPAVHPIGLGCMGMSWVYAPQERDEEAAIRTIRQALDLGLDLFDTADLYGPFSNERLLGRALTGRRDRAVVATKAGLVVNDAGSIHRDGSPAHLRASCEASLRRLGLDHVDLLHLHRVDPAVPLEETWGAMAELVAEGKVRGIGLSEVSVAEIDLAHAVHPVATVQSELSLWSREPLAEVLPHCRSRGIGFVACCPLGRGFLTGAFREPGDLPAGDGRRDYFPRFSVEAMRHNRALLDEFGAVARDAGHTPAQLALAWVLAQDDAVVAIPGARTLPHLTENAEAASVVLTADVRARLDALPPAVGGRY